MLDEKRYKFCQIYVSTANATQAAIAAGYSEKTAASQGLRLLKNEKVIAEIGRLRAEAAERNEVSIDYLVARFKSIAEADLRNYVEFRKIGRTMKIFLRSDISRQDTRPIKRIHQGKGSLRIELYDQLEALGQLGRHLGFFNDKLAISESIETVLSKALSDGKLKDDDLKKIAGIIVENQKRFQNAG